MSDTLAYVFLLAGAVVVAIAAARRADRNLPDPVEHIGGYVVEDITGTVVEEERAS